MQLQADYVVRRGLAANLRHTLLRLQVEEAAAYCVRWKPLSG